MHGLIARLARTYVGLPPQEGEDNFSLQAQTKIWEDLQAAERKAKARPTASISIEEADGYLDSGKYHRV